MKIKLNETTYKEIAKDNPKDRIEVIVGDDKQPDFKPQFKVQRWNNEVNCSIRLKETPEELLESLYIVEKGDKVKYIKSKRETNFYSIQNEEHPEGAYEIEVILKEKPASNVIEFTLEDKDVEYFYQPELTQKEKDEGADRPENVEGSYAIYAKTPKTNWKGGKEYKCGKVGHIYRPKITDAKGKEVWGELHIENGILSVTIPKGFLNKAVYPVLVDPTLGYTTMGASGASGSYNYATKITASENGQISSTSSGCRYIIKYGGHTRHGIYAYSSDTDAGALLTQSSGSSQGWSVDQYRIWLTETISYSITGGTSYFVCAHADNYSVRWSQAYDVSGGKGLINNSGDWSSIQSLPNPFTENSTNNYQYSIYATYTTTGGTAWSKSLSDTATATDAPAKTVGSARSDTSNVIDAASTFAPTNYVKSLSDSVSAADSLVKTITPALADSVTPSDALGKTIGTALSDTSSAADALGKTASITEADTATIIDSLDVDFSGTFTKTLADEAVVSDAITPTVTYNLALDDSVLVEDAVEATPGFLSRTYMVYEDNKLKIIVNGTLVQQYG